MRVYAHVQTYLSHLHGNAFRNVFLSEVDVFLIVIDVCSLLVRVLYVCAEVHGVARSCTDLGGALHGVARSCTDCVGRLHGVARSCTDCVGGSRSSVLFLLARCGFLKYLLISY
jgi:antirestriction protein